MTVGQVCRVVSAAIDDALDGEVWVRGSISSLTRSTNTYFNLIDPDSDGVTPASLSVVLFARDRARVNKMVQASGQVRVDDGVEVLIRGRVRFYPPQGRVQLIMSAIDPVYTLGQLEQARLRLQKELADAGLLDANAGRPSPIAPQRIGLVTSAASAAEADFVNELDMCRYSFDLVRFDSRVQGTSAPAELAAAIRAAGAQCEIVVVTRGGGARSDLAAFDHRDVAYAIAECPVPVVVGVGHETDVSVADQVAAVTVKTPTAAAAHLVGLLDRFAARVETAGSTLITAAQERVATATERVGLAEGRLHRLATRATVTAAADLSAHHSALLSGSRIVLAGHETRLVRAEATVTALDPAVMLRRGWSVTRTADGRLVRSPTDAPPGTELRTRTADGEVLSTVRPLSATSVERSPSTR